MPAADIPMLHWSTSIACSLEARHCSNGGSAAVRSSLQAPHLDCDNGFLVAIVEADAQVLGLPELVIDAVKEVVLLRMDCLRPVQHKKLNCKVQQRLQQLFKRMEHADNAAY